MSSYIEVRTTIDTSEGAQQIADTLVTRRLAACVHVSGPITSTYWWQGQIEHAQEWICTIKTKQDLYHQVEQEIREIHPYAEPEIIAIPIIEGSQGYLQWIDHETSRK